MLVGYVISDGEHMFSKFQPDEVEKTVVPRVKIIWTTSIDDAAIYRLEEHETALHTCQMVRDHTGRGSIYVHHLVVSGRA